MKFVHAADIHLGACPDAGRLLTPKREKEIWNSFEKLLQICEREQVDLLLLAGDLFHRQPLLRELKEVNYLFSKLSVTQVVMIVGNHDYLKRTSQYFDLVFPENVSFLVSANGDSVWLSDLNTEVYGLSYEAPEISDARYDKLKPQHPERINVLLGHGDIRCEDTSIPIHREAVDALGYDYVALGHLHTRIEISNRIAYTGNKGYIRGEIVKEQDKNSIPCWVYVPYKGVKED
jgi:DNA repair exonuclease SbcCD nuclease subunit